jgi:Domain of unknown function (DUF4388)
MGISGNLETMVLSELLQWLSMGQKTGTLVIDNKSKKVEKRICFDKGTIISSASTDPKEYLGRFLVNHGFLADEPVNEAVARQQQEKQLLGKILVDMGLVGEEDLHQMLQLKAEETIYDIFTWEEGDFEFLDNELPQHNMVRMSLDVQWLVLEGSRRLDEWGRIRETIPSPQCVPVLVGELDLAQASEVEERILGFIDDDRSVEDISHEAEIGLFQVASVLAVQVQAGVLKAVRPRIIEIEVPVEKPVPAPPPQVLQPMAMPAMAYPTGSMPAFAEPPPRPAPPGVEVGGRRLHFAGSGSESGSSAGGAPPPASEAESLIELAESSLQAGDLDVALKNLRKARNAEGTNAAVETAIEKGETRIEAALARAGVSLTAVPKLRCGMEELTNLDISPGEGFLLTRLDGSYNVKSILKMSPAPRLDTLMLFWRLKRSGHVSI